MYIQSAKEHIKMKNLKAPRTNRKTLIILLLFKVCDFVVVVYIIKIIIIIIHDVLRMCPE